MSYSINKAMAGAIGMRAFAAVVCRAWSQPLKSTRRLTVGCGLRQAHRSGARVWWYKPYALRTELSAGEKLALWQSTR